jgi:ectoine hydroxylase-related dioxygenase (phytanoyl-CoA dioxygenase family)
VGKRQGEGDFELPTNITASLVADLQRNGFAVIEDVVGETVVHQLRDELGDTEAAAVRDRNGATYALRNLLDIPAIRALADSDAVRALINPVLGPTARPVRGILFDKNPAANWKVAWHQDLSIAIKERRDVPGFGPWSIKAGVPHVQPPRQLLEDMLTIRLHLDDCGADNGPLLVQPGSHALGVLDPSRIVELTMTAPTACTVRRGGAILMRPLLLHASRTATTPGHRRVIHIECAAADLPGGLQWFVA